MALMERPGFQRLVEAAESRLGVTVQPLERVSALERVAEHHEEFKDEAIELAYHSLDYLGGRPQELRPEARRRLAQRSRIALRRDPLAAAEANHLANFSFGRGVGHPKAEEDEVTKVIADAWSDPNNYDKLTSPFALRKLSNDLITQGEFFVTLYESGGYIRVGRLDADRVEQVVPDDEDRLRPLWYMVRERRFRWDFGADRASFEDEMQGGQPKVVYYPHWRNVDDAKRERELANVEPLTQPPTEKRASSVVYHVAINQTGENLRGNPPWERTLRFYSAMNEFTEARVAMAQGAATFIAKRVIQGGPKSVTKAATSILAQTGELAAGMRAGPDAPDGRWPAGEPPPPGSWFDENEAMRLESMKLDSGAAAAAQDSQIIRAPLAAVSGFGQHYFGDASNANLATATSLELPAQMTVQWWQEVFEQLLRWFTDRAIEAAVRAGRLGGTTREPGELALAELSLQEAEGRREMERRTGKDLRYEFGMPYPGRRQLQDVQAMVTTVASEFDPDGVNEPLRRDLLNFFYTHALEHENPGEAVDEVMKHFKPFASRMRTPGGAADPDDPDKDVPPGERPAGVRQRSRTPEKVERDAAREAEWLPPEMRDPVADLSDEVAAEFRELVVEPGMATALAVGAPSRNGSG